MKALTLTQPWASLVASGAKGYETRSWQASYRGPVAIHAAKTFPPLARALCAVEPFRTSLLAATCCEPAELERWPETVLPLGAVVAVSWIEEIAPTEAVRDRLDLDELAFGDYAGGRFAWKLRQPVALTAPFSYRGALGLWDLPDDEVPERYRLAIRHPGLG